MSDEESATKREQAQRVREMFATIATRYDLLNHLLSGNIDRRWRRLVVERVVANLPVGNARVLDVACGTGDLSLALVAGTQAQVVGLDFCRPMLDIAAAKSSQRRLAIPFVEGDALRLPFPDQSFDAASIAFGLRNLASVEGGLRELLRILRPGGTLAVLEFSKPQTPILRTFFRVYFTNLLPLFGGLISGSKSAYEYLPNSVSRFPDQTSLAAMMEEIGFTEVTFQNLTGGIAALHLGKRPKK
ncbi:MAG TPA: bifunctional demethylmenaquinone methyltransferase/2-methoxy-6-polyprenyl-1,4-benzoquinol methylase UbiE [Pyrinomonadaceae bacterium]|nr:bifunctional demethylmenaquinone methyltransferase/2-methoxy-6-polyprenyl-1,4-benzoquinol methylase UbiE [Pyrinomonadaceae bacterium]